MYVTLIGVLFVDVYEWSLTAGAELSVKRRVDLALRR